MGNRQTDALHYTAFPSVPGVSAASLKAVASGLAFAADNETGACFPSYRDLADRGGMTRRGAIEVVGWLEAIGFITVQARKQRGGKESTSNLYTLREVVDIPEEEVHYRKGVKAFRGWTARIPGNTLLFTHPMWCRDCTTVVKPVHQGGEGASPESLTELLKSTLKRMLKENDSTTTSSAGRSQSISIEQGTPGTSMGDKPEEKPKDPAPAHEPAFEPAHPVEPACPPAPQGPPPQTRPSPPLIAKFAGTCPKCRGKINPGDAITGMSNNYSHAQCPTPPPNPNDRVVNGVTYSKEETFGEIEDPDGGGTACDWYRMDPDGSYHFITGDEARALGLPLDQKEESAAGVTVAGDEDDFGGLLDPTVTVRDGDDEDEREPLERRPAPAAPQPPAPDPVPEPPRLPARKKDPLPGLRAEFLASKYPDLARDTESVRRLAAEWTTLGQDLRDEFDQWMESRKATAGPTA